jgi:SAM-dependent methyltransferase
MMAQNTDKYWQLIGSDNPYWGVITHDKFDKDRLTLGAIEEFYKLGEEQVGLLFQKIHKYVDDLFAPESALDFGCGVGRVLLPLARRCRTVVGVDVSDGMLQRARERFESQGLSNGKLVKGDDQLSGVTGSFDLIHSFIVFQHITPERGYVITDRLLKLLKADGVGVLHFVYYKEVISNHPKLRAFAEGLGVHNHVSAFRAKFQRQASSNKNGGPGGLEMQMNPYNLNVIFQKLQSVGVRRMHVEYTDHGGFFGVVLFFKKAASDTYCM